jgi:hypothetical protein
MVFNKLCVPHLKEAGVEFKPGSHNNYVMRIGYLLNEYGIPLDSAVTWAAGKFGADYPQTANIIANCYAAQPDEFGKAASLVQRLNVGYKPSPDESGYASVLEIEEFLSRVVETRRNLIRERLEYRVKDKSFGLTLRCVSPFTVDLLPSLPGADSAEPSATEVRQNCDSGADGGVTEVCQDCNNMADRGTAEVFQNRNDSDADESRFEPLTDIVAKSLWVRMSHERKVKLTDIYNVLESDFSTPYNPIFEYLKSLRAWTPGQPDYIAELAATVTVKGDESEQQRFAEYLKKWLVGMVAGWLDSDVVNHEILVFIGGQGCNKSTWFNYLLPVVLKEYYCVKIDSTNLDKDATLLLSQSALINLEEVDVMTGHIANYFKGSTTVTNTFVRSPYARYPEWREHISSYCATGNNTQFLTEEVSRRWLPFMVEKIVSPRDFPFNHDGFFSQALYLYRSGFRYWFNAEEIEVVSRHNRDFQTPSLEEELISCCFRKPGPEEIGQFFPTSLILKYIADNIGSKLSPIKVGMAMQRLGFERKRIEGIKGWICIPLSAEEIIDNRKRMALHAEDC